MDDEDQTRSWTDGLAEAVFFWVIFYGIIATAIIQFGLGALLDAVADDYSIRDNVPNNILVLGGPIVVGAVGVAVGFWASRRPGRL